VFEGYRHFTGPPVISYSTINKSIWFVINVFTGRVVTVSCHEGYQGKFLDKIGVDTTIHQAWEADDSLRLYSVHNAIYSMSNPGISFEVEDLGDNDNIFITYGDMRIQNILIGLKDKLY